tara:strand:- start:151457 stop:151606 length:150 start_codon:yes stop_codon:yes gene_type:complete
MSEVGEEGLEPSNLLGVNQALWPIELPAHTRKKTSLLGEASTLVVQTIT